jgi:large subunit ribosomal protein L10
MVLTRLQKSEQLAQISDWLSHAKAVIFVENKGLKVGDQLVIQKTLKEAGYPFKFVKTTLLGLAAKSAKMEIPTELLAKPIALVVSSGDELAAAKAVYTQSKSHEGIEFAGALIDGKFVDAQTVTDLALLPGQDELYARLVGTLANIPARLVYALGFNGRALVNVLKQYQEKGV